LFVGETSSNPWILECHRIDEVSSLCKGGWSEEALSSICLDGQSHRLIEE